MVSSLAALLGHRHVCWIDLTITNLFRHDICPVGLPLGRTTGGRPGVAERDRLADLLEAVSIAAVPGAKVESGRRRSAHALPAALGSPTSA